MTRYHVRTGLSKLDGLTQEMRDGMIDGSRGTIEKTIAYVVITFALSVSFYYVVISSGSLMSANGIYAAGLMWCPGIAAMTTQIVYRENLRDLGWSWGETRYRVWSYLIPLVYASVAYFFVWSTGLGRFSGAEFVRSLASQLGLQHVPIWIIAAAYLVVTVTLGTVVACITALGKRLAGEDSWYRISRNSQHIRKWHSLVG